MTGFLGSCSLNVEELCITKFERYTAVMLLPSTIHGKLIVR